MLEPLEEGPLAQLSLSSDRILSTSLISVTLTEPGNQLVPHKFERFKSMILFDLIVD